MVLANQTYDDHKRLTLPNRTTNPELVAIYSIRPGTDRVCSNGGKTATEPAQNKYTTSGKKRPTHILYDEQMSVW